MVLRIAAAIAALLLAAPASASGPLAGHWISVGPTWLSLDQHMEAMEIAPDGTVALRVFRLDPGRDPACLDDAPPRCENPVLAARGRVAAEPGGGAFRIEEVTDLVPPFSDPHDNEAWPEVSGFSPEGWTHALDGDRLELTRPVTLGGRDLTLTRLFHRVEPGFDRLLFDYLALFVDVPLPRAICPLDVILGDAALGRAFTARLTAAAPAFAMLEPEWRALLARGAVTSTDSPPMLLLRQAQSPGMGKQAPEGYDPEGWAILVDTLGWRLRHPDQDLALFPGAVARIGDMRACEDALHAPRIDPSRLADGPPVLPAPDPAALLAAGLIAPPGAGEDDFTGHWLHAGDPLGFVIGHLEVLEIAADGTVTVHVHRSDPFYNPACAGASPPECANPAAATRGRLALDPAAGRFAIDGAEDLAAPFHHAGDAAGWEVIRTAVPEGWLYRRSGDRLELVRGAEVDGRTVTLSKVFHRVGPDFPAALNEFAATTRQLLARSGCALGVILPDPELHVAFAWHLALLLPGERRFAELASEARERRDEETVERYRTVVLTQNEQAGTPALAIVPPEGFDEDDGWTAMILHSRWLAAEPDQEPALFPAAVPHLPAINACIDRYRGR